MGLPHSRLYCADERGQCNFGGTKNVYYEGNVNHQSVIKLTNSIPCNNDAFGSDPDRGNGKTCWIDATAGDENNPNDPSINGGVWLFCGKEGSDCTAQPGQRVAFGLPGRWAYATKSGKFHCGNDNDFGHDPASGLTKACYLGTPSQAPAPAAPAPSSAPTQPTPPTQPQPVVTVTPTSQGPVVTASNPPASQPVASSASSGSYTMWIVMGVIFFIILVVVIVAIMMMAVVMILLARHVV
jgi:hypothetical protein